MAKAHCLKLRIYYEDTDAGRIVYHANYLKFAERGRTEMLRQAGFDHPTMLATYAFGFAVRHCQVDYLKPAFLDDEIAVYTRISRVTGARLFMAQEIWRSDDLLVRVAVTLACLGGHGRSIRMPGQIFAALLNYVDMPKE